LKSPVIAHRIQGGVVLQPFALAESILDGFVKVIERLVRPTGQSVDAFAELWTLRTTRVS
jgi:hypothetical protein